jgi:hypothetical protein
MEHTKLVELIKDLSKYQHDISNYLTTVTITLDFVNSIPGITDDEYVELKELVTRTIEKASLSKQILTELQIHFAREEMSLESELQK